MTGHQPSRQDMGASAELPIVAKLTQERTHDFGRALLGAPLNPDGPEAAEIIGELYEALDKCRAIIKFHVKDSGACCTLSGSDKPFSALDAFQEAVAALAKARGETA